MVKDNFKQKKLMDFFHSSSKPDVKPYQDSPQQNPQNRREKYHGIELVLSDFHAMNALEQQFCRAIPLLSKAKGSSFGFDCEDGHITELRLTQFSLQGLIQVMNLPEAICDLAQLRMLDLQLTNVSSLPNHFGALNNLEVLNLRYNRLTTLPESWGNLHQLQQLDLSHNRLIKLPILFQDLEKLRYLDLSENAFLTLPDSIGSCRSLQFLDLSKNRIEQLPLSLGYLENLRHLDISANYLETLPSTIQNLHLLEILDLHENKLTDHAFTSIIFPSTLRSVYLGGNPFVKCEFRKIFAQGWKFWPIFHIPTISLRSFELKYCPTHGKILRIEKKFINKLKGWIEFRFYCPVDSCPYQELATPTETDIMELETTLNNESSKKTASKLHFPITNSSCPPHDLLYFEIGDRFIERCAKCNKSREEIENNNTNN